MKKALLVIDMQNVCVGEKHATYFKYDNENLIQAVNKVIDENKDNPVIYIKNIMKKNLINKLAPFKLMKGLKKWNWLAVCMLYLIIYSPNTKETHLVIRNLMSS